MKNLTVLACVFVTLLLQSQTQVGQNLNGLSFTSFGASVAMSSDGNIIAAGAVLEDGPNGAASGVVRIYGDQNGVWTQIGGNIEGRAAEDRSGSSVSLSDDGSIVAIGAPKAINNSGGSLGNVRLFENIAGTWTQIGQDIEAESNTDRFGFAVSLSADGTAVAITAVGNDTNGNESGQTKIYKNISGTWTQMGQSINGDSANSNSGFTVELSADGNRVAIGEHLNDNVAFESGQVRVFENISNVWTQIGQNLNGEAANDRFGRGLAFSNDGSVLAVGAPESDASGFNAGLVRVYNLISNQWTQVGGDIVGENADELSGYTLSMSSDGSKIAVSAPFNGDNGFDTGIVRFYSNQNNNWNELGNGIAYTEEFSFFGGATSLSNDGTKIVIGSEGANFTNGLVQVYDLNPILSSNEVSLNTQFKLYPNPSQGIVNIELPEEVILNSVSIYDNLGRRVTQFENRENVNTSNLSAGMYLLEINTNKGKASKKIVVN